MKKRIVQIILAVCLLLPLLTATGLAEPEETSGSWENGPSWSYDESSKTLTISGTGDIPNANTTAAPYAEYKDSIEKIIIEDGVGNIGESAFCNCGTLTSVEFKGSAGDIGASAFRWCGSLHRIILPEGVTAIKSHAFSDCKNLTAIYIPSTVDEISGDAFDSSYLKDIYYGGTEEQWEEFEFFQQNEDLPVVHYGSDPKFPETEAGNVETLQQLIKNEIGAGLTEIELTGDIDMGNESLIISGKSNILLDLKGHKITSTADPAFEAAGSLTVIDSSVNADGCIDGSIGTINVLPGGSFTLNSGTVSSSSGNAVIVLSNAAEETENLTGAHVDINGGTVSSGNSQFSCGIYQVGEGSICEVSGGKIIVENGIGILVRKGSLWINDNPQPEISAGGSGTGTFGGSDRELEAGKPVVLDQGDSSNHGISYYLSNSLLNQFQPTDYPADNTQTLKNEPADNRTHYFFGDTTCYTVTFNPNGGPELTPESVQTDSSGKIPDLPDNLERDGYVFRGWSTDRESIAGTVKKGDTISRDTTLYAVWTPTGTYLITFQLGSNTFPAYAYKLTGTDGVLTDWPKPPAGYADGWYPTSSGEADVYSKDHQFTQDTIVYAHRVSGTPPYEITFIFDDDRIDKRTTNDAGKLENWPEKPEREGYVFKGWSQWHNGTTVANEESVFFENTTLYPRWMPEGGYAVRFFLDAPGPAAETLHTNLNLRATLDNWPRTPLDNDRFFVGWYTTPSGGSRMAVDHRFEEDTDAYAQWIAKSAAEAAGRFVITFDYNGGSDGSGGSSSVELVTDENHRLMFLPYNVPVREGYTFSGWFTELSGGEEVTADKVFTGNTTVYAHWTKNGSPDVPEPEGFTVTFNANGGTVTPATGTTGEDKTLAELPVPVREGYTFDGWYTELNGGEKVTVETVFSANKTIYAHWKDSSLLTYTLTVSGGAGGGEYAEGAEVTITANAAPAGKAFDKWTTSGGGTFANAASAATTFTMPANDVTVTATYKDAAAAPEQTYTLTVTGGTGGGEYAAGTEVTITADTAPNGKVFDIWTSSSGGIFADAASAVTTFTMPANDVTVSAGYKDAAATPGQTSYMVYFNPNGGTVDIASMVTGADGRLPSLPIPRYNGYVFSGWYTAPIGGSFISANTVFTGNTTVYAHWVFDTNISDNRSSSLTEYAVVTPSTIGGTVTASRDFAAEGVTITITVTPDIGYEMTSLIARDSWWNELELTDRGGGRYTLTMPNKAVSVNAAFAPAAWQSGPMVRPGRIWPYPGFTDVFAGAWYYDAVRFVCETGLMKGLSSTAFSPDAYLSRAQLTQILYNMAGSPAAGSVSGFADVASGDWYAGAVAWAVSRNLIDGYDGGTFGPYDYVTREEIVAMLWRYAGKPASERELSFSDSADISTYALTAVRWAVEKGILNGNSDGALTPKGLATRAQVAQMLKNYFNA